MHPLYEDAMQTADALKEARLEIAHLSSKLAQAEYDLSVAQAKVERGWIKKAGGEKQLAPTAEARARIFTLALDADEEYRDKLVRRDAVQAQLEQAKVEAGYLRDRLSILLAAMKSHEIETDI